jgi:hypothetical protein
MENNLLYSLDTQTQYLNLARDLSRVNSKNEEVTTRDGHVYGYMVEMKFLGMNPLVYAAPNSWRMRNAFRKFHAYRNIMFENAGVEGDELGRYGKTIRPYLDYGHTLPTSVTLDPATSNSQSGDWDIDGGEWTYSQLATTPTYVEGPTPNVEEPWADAFSLHICEENIVQGDTVEKSGYYKSVGMIHSYNIDRQEPRTAIVGTGETITGPSNPLAQLISSGNQAVGEVIDITEDQELEFPPYDLEDDGDSIQVAPVALSGSTAEFPVAKLTAFLPAGLARIYIGAAASGYMHVRVLGKVLCKDMA